MSVFNHRLNDRSVKQLRDRQIAQRDMLQQFQKKMRLLFLYQCLWGDAVWVATPIFQENTAAAYCALTVSKNRSNCVMTPSVYNKQSDRLSGYPGTLNDVGPLSLYNIVWLKFGHKPPPEWPPRGHYAGVLLLCSWNNVLWQAMTGVLSSPSFAPKQMKPIHNDLCFFTGQTED